MLHFYLAIHHAHAANDDAMVNALTRKTGLTLGPIILETLVKHYFERLSNAHDEEETTRLRKEELLYDEAFNIVKVRAQSCPLSCGCTCSPGMREMHQEPRAACR